MKYPVMGEELIVNKRVNYDRRGNPVLKSTKPITRIVSQVYSNCRVKDSSGDAWEVDRNIYGKLQTIR